MFIQEDFSYQDLFLENTYLKDVLSFYIPSNHLGPIQEDIQMFSKRTCTDVLKMSEKAEREEPDWVPFDHWGNRVDDIKMSDGWEDLHKVAAEEGLIAIGYERKNAEFSRLHQFMKLMLFHSSSAYYTCPLAMTDGATRVLETQNTKGPKETAFDHLVSRNGGEFWTAGQWMTEKIGGSDVSGTETVAELKDGKYYLTGEKWFTSAITANIAFTLARALNPKTNKEALSMFFVRIRDEEGKLDNIEVLRLKDKLGTRAMPTAELALKGCEATLVGEHGEGVKNIATVLNISRLYNAICATGAMYRLISLSRDFSKKRTAFGKKLSEHPLHSSTLFDCQTKVSASVLFVHEVVSYLGKSEVGVATEEEKALLRLMTPIAKLWTGKHGVQVVSELVESFGGAGYIEDTGIPKYLRDAQVLSIWEGTTNILSLDTLRAMSKNNVLELSLSSFSKRINELPEDYTGEKNKLVLILKEVKSFIKKHMGSGALLENSARILAFSLGDVFSGILLCEFACKTKKKRDELIARRFCQNVLTPVFVTDKNQIEETQEALFSV